MTAYLAGDYAASVACLSQWLDAAPSEDAGLAGLASEVVAKIGVLAQAEDGARIAADAGRLQDGIARLRGAGELSGAARA
jgi:hypothetical protein